MRNFKTILKVKNSKALMLLQEIQFINSALLESTCKKSPALGTASPAGQGWGLSHSALYWGRLTSSAGGIVRAPQYKKDTKLLECPKQGNEDGEGP